jgi:PIN domain nuclease of toxin-antitoxin system
VSYLVDTNAWIAFFENSPHLSEESAQILESGAECFISIASIWEASIKAGIGKLKLPYDLRDGLPSLIEDNGFSVLPVEFDDATAVADLPMHHGDPFDRIMAVQAMRRAMKVISRDPVFERYGLRRVW